MSDISKLLIGLKCWKPSATSRTKVSAWGARIRTKFTQFIIYSRVERWRRWRGWWSKWTATRYWVIISAWRNRWVKNDLLIFRDVWCRWTFGPLRRSAIAWVILHRTSALRRGRVLTIWSTSLGSMLPDLAGLLDMILSKESNYTQGEFNTLVVMVIVEDRGHRSDNFLGC